MGHRRPLNDESPAASPAGPSVRTTAHPHRTAKGRTTVKIEIELMTPAEVAKAFGADPKTVTRWAVAGRLDSFMTPGGHRRFYAAQIEAMVTGQPVPTVAQIRGAK